MASRKITVENKTYIGPLQMYGPIINPISVPDSIVIELVRKGYTVNEKLKNGSRIRLNSYNVKNPTAAVTQPATSTPVQAKPVVEPTVQTTPVITTTPVVEKVVVEEPTVIDDGIRDYGEPVSEINVVPVSAPVSPKIIEVPPTPEESGVSIMTVQDVKTEETPVEPYIMPEAVLIDAYLGEDESVAEAPTESEEPTTDSNNQARKNKKKKRR